MIDQAVDNLTLRLHDAAYPSEELEGNICPCCQDYFMISKYSGYEISDYDETCLCSDYCKQRYDESIKEDFENIIEVQNE